MNSDEKEKSGCWKRVGVWGTELPRCPDLPRVIHCRNCEVFIRAGRDLLERDLPKEYKDAWTEAMGQEKEDGSPGTTSVVIFRIGGEWLAINARLFAEVIEPMRPHTIPHRSSAVLKGLVNVHGELQLCVSLKALLNLNDSHDDHRTNKAYMRMVVLERSGERWVFPVDEVHGIHRIHPDAFQNVPVTVSKGTATFTKAIFSWDGGKVAFIDEDLLFQGLLRSAQ